MTWASTDHCSAMAPQDIAGAWTTAARREQEPGPLLVRRPQTATDQLNPRARPTVNTTETACSPLQEPSYLSVTTTDSTQLNSATAPLDIAGVWTSWDRRGKERGRHLVHQPKTVTNQTNRCVPRASASITETASRPPAQRDIPYWESLCLSVMQMDSTCLYSATALLVIAGVWTVMDRRRPEPEHHLVHHPETVTNQCLWARPCVPRQCVSAGGPA